MAGTEVRFTKSGEVMMTSEWIALAGFILTVATLIFKFGRIDESLKNLVALVKAHGTEIDEVHSLIEGFHGECNKVTNRLNTTMTESRHMDLCDRKQRECMGSVCKKIDSIRDELRETTKFGETYRTVVSQELTRIAVFMGEIKTRNKMIDEERSQRRHVDL